MQSGAKWPSGFISDIHFGPRCVKIIVLGNGSAMGFWGPLMLWPWEPWLYKDIYIYIYIYILFTRIERTQDMHRDMGPRGTTGSLAPGAAHPERGGRLRKGPKGPPCHGGCPPHVAPTWGYEFYNIYIYIYREREIRTTEGARRLAGAVGKERREEVHACIQWERGS